MNRRLFSILILALAVLLCGVPIAVRYGIVLAQAGGPYDLSWSTVDGGGGTFSTGGPYTLGGTIGQPDATVVPMTGGEYELVGGFWSLPPCWRVADLNNDGLTNGLDIQGFTDCMLGGGANCACADVDTNGVLNMVDVAMFVDGLLADGFV